MFRSHVFLHLSGVTKSFSKTSEKDNVTKALNIATCLASLVEIAIAILNVLERVYARINNKVNLGCRAPAVLPMLWLPPLAPMADLPLLTAIESIMMYSTSKPGAHVLICSKSSCRTPFIVHWRSFEQTLCHLPYFSRRAIQGRPLAKTKNAGEKVSAVLQWATSVFPKAPRFPP